MLSVLQLFTHSPLRNFSYIVYSDRSGEAVCIDPYDAKLILTHLKKHGLKLKSILNTHEHNDHVAGNLELKEETKALIYSHPNALGKIPGLDEVLKEGDIAFSHESETLVAWDTPGHTNCHLCFVLKNKTSHKAVFSGDTIFNAGVGNCYRGGNPSTLYNTLKNRFFSIEGETLLYPGHDYWDSNLNFSETMEPDNKEITKIRNLAEAKKETSEFLVSDFSMEKKVNPFFRLEQTTLQNNIREKNKETDFDSEKSYFLGLRRLRDHW
ncbi:hydroxyacylglutathione hydrolase family protein [Leptospira idonii]|uniref:hydroxyacylglutathione hydrolase n=1 Tax=Leptospira idonii TaxID=1193500 RepID=A0A4R9LXK7_9LEPT|nr:hydroxyacylglutathione hydrolase family protein [Leptospira idonii]TGN18412.1 hydroxyacylglutathione hydrolase [Leptospira idonii]